MLPSEVIVHALRGGHLTTDWGRAMAATDATGGNMSSWIEQQQRRIQQLEAENARLRWQLGELQRGVGIALLIQGRAIPLTVLPEPQPSPPIYGSVSDGPRMLPHSSTPAGLQVPNVASSAAPMPSPASRAPSTPFPEDAWLSDSGSALMSPPHVAPIAPRQGMSSQDMTPTWLRESPPTPQSSQSNQAWRPQAPRSPHSQVQPADRTPARVRTLGHITGQRQAARQRHSADPRTPFSDSFVLG